jgi:ubiquinone/menaquinone biosynthesis C-methylase UbiE
LSLLSGPSPLVLVIGGGTIGNGVEALYADRRIRIIGFDIYGSPMTQFIADAHQIPLASDSVDAVVIQAVLEHVLDPGQVVREIHRVLRRDGLVYAETPFLQQVHAGPYDFVRYTSSGHRYLFRAFEEIAAGPVAGPGTQLLWSVEHMVRGLLRSELAGKLARALLFWLRSLDRLVPPAFAMDNASGYYFLGRRADRELTPSEIVSYYRGAQWRS